MMCIAMRIDCHSGHMYQVRVIKLNPTTIRYVELDIVEMGEAQARVRWQSTNNDQVDSFVSLGFQN